MFDIFKNRKNVEIIVGDEQEEKNKDKSEIKMGAGFAATESARASTQAAAKKFAKPDKYTRSVLDDGAAKRNIKVDAFKKNVQVKDPYTGDVLTLTKAEAKMKYGSDWTKHLSEADHKISLERRYKQTKDNPWLTNDDIKASSNSSDNLEVVSRKFNNAKRKRSNKDFVSDDEYLKKTDVKLSKKGKQKAIESEKKAQAALKKRDRHDTIKNIAKTGHKAGVAAAKNAGVTGLTMSGIMNLTAVIKGEKDAKDALKETVIDGGKAAATGYLMGGGLTTVSHTLSNSSSTFLKALAGSNVPGNVITAVMLTGDTLKKYSNGEISTQDCILELGEKGLNFATTGYAMAVGQTLIPIPIVGAAIGALVGSTLTSKYYNELVNTLKTKQLEHEERLRIIEECKKATEEHRKFGQELESYLESYFNDYQDCFNEALADIKISFQIGDVDGIIGGANQITRKLGGKVNYDTIEECKHFLFDGATDVL